MNKVKFTGWNFALAYAERWADTHPHIQVFPPAPENILTNDKVLPEDLVRWKKK